MMFVSRKHLLMLLLGFAVGAAFMTSVFVASTHRSPVVPVLKQPNAIKVTLHPWQGFGESECSPVEIPPGELDSVYRLIAPEKYFEGGVNDFISPIIAEAVITHADAQETTLLIRDFGHNPALVTVDGRSYFFARNDPDILAGANQLIRLVNSIKQKAGRGVRSKS